MRKSSLRAWIYDAAALLGAAAFYAVMLFWIVLLVMT